MNTRYRHIILLLALCMTAMSCSTPQSATPQPPDLSAVITTDASGHATLNCVLHTQTPIDRVWQTLSISDANTGENLPHSLLDQMENMATTTTASIEDSHHLMRAKKTHQEQQTTYISTARIHLPDLTPDQSIKISLIVDNQQVTKEIR